MAFRKDKPEPDDTFSESQPYLQQNFAAIKKSFDANHIALDGLGTGEGKHKWITLYDAAKKIPETGANEGAVYIKPGPIQNIQELWFRRESNGEEICMTERNASNNGFSRISSGQVIKWGSFDIAAGIGEMTQTLNSPNTPQFNNIYQVYASVNINATLMTADINAMIYIINFTVNDFLWILRRRNFNPAAGAGTDRGITNIKWFAIGD